MQDRNTIEKAIGKNIKRLRKAKGMTQSQLAEILDISTNYLSDIERGISFPRIEKLVAVINILGCSADDMFADVIDSGYKVKASRLSDQIEKLSPEDREKAFAVLEAFYLSQTVT